MVNSNKTIVYACFFLVMFSCTTNESSLLEHLQFESILTRAQYEFLDSKYINEVEIDENEMLTGTIQDMDKDIIHYFKTDLSFINVKRVALPGSRFENQLVYRNKDTLIDVIHKNGNISFYKSIDLQPFQLFAQIAIPNDRERYSISSISMKNSNTGYYTLYRNGVFLIDQVKLIKFDNGSLTELRSMDRLNASIKVLPSGDLILSEYIERGGRIDKIAVSKSSNEGISWTSDTIFYANDPFTDKVYRQRTFEVIENDFFTSCLRTSSRCYYSTDAVNWNEFFPNRNDVDDVQFFNKQEGFASTHGFGFGGDLYLTADMGKMWTRINRDEEYLVDFHFTNLMIGVYVGGSAIKVTRDGGVTWELVAHNTGLFSN